MDKSQAQQLQDLEKRLGKAYAADDSVAFRIRNVKYPGSTAHTHDVIVTSGTDLELKTDGSTDATLSFSTYTTVGDLVDAINNEDGWEAEVVDAERSASIGSNELIARSSSTIRPREKVEINWDVSNKGDWTLAIEIPDGDFVEDDYRNQHRVGLSRVIAKNNVSSGTPTLEVYEIDKERDDKEKVAEFEMADDTELDEDIPVDTDFGNDLLIKVTGNVQDSGGYLRAFGKRQ